MKYYYEGQLIRTSKTHHYAFACINKNKGKDGKYQVYGCSATRAGAEKVKQRELSWETHCIEGWTKALKVAERNGKTKNGHTKEDCERNIEVSERTYKGIAENWIIVEIEEREA